MSRRIISPANFESEASASPINFDVIRLELELPGEFSPEAATEAAAVTDRYATERVDRTDIAFVTIDPPGSKDLDQAVRLVHDGDGYLVQYAIADVAALITPEGLLDNETRHRGQTIYLPDGSIPLHPRVLSEGAGSLLPEQIRPAVLWEIKVDAEGQPTSVTVSRALVKSVARLDYAGVQKSFDDATPHSSIAALADFGRCRQALAIARGAVNLELPEQSIAKTDAGWVLEVEKRTDVDLWNSHVSLLTGMAAGEIMRTAGVGLLRTLPKPEADTLQQLRKSAAALGVSWDRELSAGEFLAGLDPIDPRSLAIMSDATSLLRGANYLAFDATTPLAADAVTEHAGIAGVYAHVTAPLRRLADRFATEVCLAVKSGNPVPEWVLRALPTLPDLMKGSDSLANKAERAAVDLAEATVLENQIGTTFSAMVLHEKRGDRPGEIFISEPAIIAPCVGELTEGETIMVRLTRADVRRRKVEFSTVTN